MPRFATADGKGTNDAAMALQSDGRPVDNSVRNVWVTKTALSTALNASYMAESISLFAIVVGIALLLSGIGFGILAAGGTLSGGSPPFDYSGTALRRASPRNRPLRRNTSSSARWGPFSGPHWVGEASMNTTPRASTPIPVARDIDERRTTER